MPSHPAAAFAGVCAISIASPFELIEPVGRSRWQSIGNLELLLLVVFAVWFAVVAILVHGLVHSFLSFSPTYVLIALTLGFMVACTRSAETVPDANRV